MSATSLKIAQVAPLFESVPPACYGGTERVVSNLADELVRLGHDVTLFASADSNTCATLMPMCPRALRLDTGCRDQLAWHVLMLESVAARAKQFDIVHFHIGHFHFPLLRRLEVAHVTTQHGRLDLPELGPLYDEFSDMPLISISDAQRHPLSMANWVATVHHGLPETLFDFQAQPGEYLAFLGRISPEKRVDRAIAIATALGLPLRIAAKVDPADVEYFEQDVRPLLTHPLIEFIGEIGEREKNSFLGHARALLFPIDWPEPFGLVMIEALACGTPIVAFRAGSVEEVIEHGRTGFIVDDMEEAIEATRHVPSLDRRECRRSFEQRFTARRMVERHVSVYSELINARASLRDKVAVAGAIEGPAPSGDEGLAVQDPPERGTTTEVQVAI
jgi:glycosyltransferase involved in cell wall biosynthesis